MCYSCFTRATYYDILEIVDEEWKKNLRFLDISDKNNYIIELEEQ
jgi:hypothetical protein